MLNNQIFFALYNLSHKSPIFDWVIIFLGDILPYIVVLSVLVFLLFHHEVLQSKTPFKEFKQKWKEIVLVFFSGILAWCFSYVLKFIIHMPRPFDVFSQINTLFPETGYGFPSGHATFYMALAIAVFFTHKKSGYILMVIAFSIGLARIAAGVHFPGDIIGGFLLGTLIAYFVRLVYDKIYKNA